jgi:hypothetical protein
MGVEVSWRDIKAISSSLVSLAQFICTLCKLICRQLGEEHRNHLRAAGDANAFIRYPNATKNMYDAVQAMHPKILSACFIMATSTSKAHPEILSHYMKTVMELAFLVAVASQDLGVSQRQCPCWIVQVTNCLSSC